MAFLVFPGESSTLMTKALNMDDYTIDFDNKVGSGATASVYFGSRSRDAEAIKGEPDELVLKVLTPKPDASDCDDEIAILRKEVAVLANVQGHPNIVGFYGVCLVGSGIIDVQSHAIQMEYCGGGDLITAVAKRRFDEHRAHGVIGDILQGLAHMHECGFVHRDVKPENVLLTSNTTIKLTDFGISASLSDEVAMQKRCGSPGYVAPEVWSGHKYGIEIDTFACGALLYFIISGKVAFSGSSLESVRHKTISDPVNFRRSMCLERLSDDCKGFMLALLEKDPKMRPCAVEAVGILWTLPAPPAWESTCRGSSKSTRTSSKGSSSTYRSSHSNSTLRTTCSSGGNVDEGQGDVRADICKYAPTKPKEIKPTAPCPARWKFKKIAPKVADDELPREAAGGSATFPTMVTAQ